MNQRSLFIPVMYWIFRIAFWLHLCITLFFISVDSLDWVGWLHHEPLTYTIRGSFGMHPNVFRPDTTFHQLTSGNHPETITMVSHSGWARFDYKDLSTAFTFDNLSITLLDSFMMVLWLSMTYLLYKMMESCKNKQVFEGVMVRRIRILACVIGLTGLLEFAKNWMFANVAYNYISYDNFSVVMKKVDILPGLFYALLILVIAEVVKYGASIKQENDLTI